MYTDDFGKAIECQPHIDDENAYICVVCNTIICGVCYRECSECEDTFCRDCYKDHDCDGVGVDFDDDSESYVYPSKGEDTTYLDYAYGTPPNTFFDDDSLWDTTHGDED